MVFGGIVEFSFVAVRPGALGDGRNSPARAELDNCGRRDDGRKHL